MLVTLRSLENQNDSFFIGREFRKDLLWWDQFLVRFNGISFIPDMLWSRPDAYLSTDACLLGIGGWSNESYFSSRLPDFIRVKEFHINILEMLAILIALRLWHKKFVGMRLQIFCDNEASVSVINVGKSRDVNMLAILREILHIWAVNNFQIRAVHLPGVDNRKADFLSRAQDKSEEIIKNVMGPRSSRCEVSPSDFMVKESW